MSRHVFSAHCAECNATYSFSTYEDRSDWVGKHRVSTGHSVTQDKT